jgi:hypothetical protein
MKKQPLTIISAAGTARNRLVPPSKIVAAIGKAGKGDKPGRRRTAGVSAAIIDGPALVLFGKRKKMDDGPKSPRRPTVIRKAINDARAALGPNAAWPQVLKHACDHADVERDGDRIWYGPRRERSIGLSHFQNLVSEMKHQK